MSNSLASGISAPLLFLDFETWLQFFQRPTPRFAALWERFGARLGSDEEFRRSNLYLPALLGEAWALQKAREQILTTAQSYGMRGREDGAIEHHTWCVAPNVMRLAVYHDWLARHAVWTASETEAIGNGLLHFCYEHAVAVLRSRVPAGDNQSLSMALTCAVVGTAFRQCPPLAERAQALEAFGNYRLGLCFQYFPEDGYSGEGATYQSHVVSPLVMWADAYHQQTGIRPDTDLHKILMLETLMTSPGDLQWPLDHYGWQNVTNLAAKAALARRSGDWSHLEAAERVWDSTDYIAWGRDDRMWTLIHWPSGEEAAASGSPGSLGGWSLSRVGAALDHGEQKARALLVWDESSAVTQALTRVQVNPNHLVYERNGEPLFADGATREAGFLPVTSTEAAHWLPDAAKELLMGQYGSLDAWFNGAEIGLLGASNTLLPAGQEGYFPYGGARGRMHWEQRTATNATVTAECLDYFPAEWGLTRARRTVDMDQSGLVWIVDDYQGSVELKWAWQCYLRPEAELGTRSVLLDVPAAPTVLAWEVGAFASLTDVPNFPWRGDGKTMCWPSDGSRKLYLDLGPRESVLWATCVLPFAAADAGVEKTGDWTWVVRWAGGESSFTLPVQALRPDGFTDPVDGPATINDLDAVPFYPYDEVELPTAELLGRLASADKDDWRLLTRGFQTLAARDEVGGLPIALEMMDQPGHHYQSRSVAGWYLGRFGYLPAEPMLRRLLHTPETNLSHRARWGLERIENAPSC